MDATNNRFYRETSMTDKRVDIIAKAIKEHEMTSYWIHPTADVDKTVKLIAQAAIDADPVTVKYKALYKCLANIADDTLPNFCGVPTQVMNYIEIELKKWSGE